MVQALPQYSEQIDKLSLHVEVIRYLCAALPCLFLLRPPPLQMWYASSLFP